MAVTHDIGPLSRQRREGVGPQVMFASALLLAVAAWVFVERVFTSDHSLPLVTTLLFGLAALATLVAWRRGKMARHHLTYWDVAGALTFIGIGTAALIDAEQMLRLVESGIGAQDFKTSDR
jgi:MYXO-CTERM domain-containing protein